MKKWFLIFLFPLVSSAAEGVDQKDLILAPPSPTNSGCNLSHAGIKDKNMFLNFYEGMKAAARAGDKEKISQMVHYPIWVYVTKTKRKPLKSAKEFSAYFKRILTPKVAAVVEQQRMEDIFCNYQGVMLGQGEVWLGISNDGILGIKVINNKN